MVLAAQGESFDLLLGRRTYDLWSGFWPKAPKSPMADRLNAATKYVVTHRPESLEWGHSKLLTEHRGWRSRHQGEGRRGPDPLGSSTLTSALLEHGLADEALLLVYPVLLAKGNAFCGGTPARALALDSTQASPTGILVNTYKVVGPLQNQR